MNNPLDQVIWPDLAELRHRRSAKWSLYDDDVLPMPVAEMDCLLAPPIATALNRVVALGDTGYPPFDRGVHEAFAGFASRRWGWQVDPDQVTLTADVGAGMLEAITALLEPGSGMVVMPPIYPPFYRWAGQTGMRNVEVPLLLDESRWRMDLDGIDRALADGAKAVLLCNPHNPVGHVHTRTELEALAEVVARHPGAVVLSDEIHAPLTLPGHTFTPYLTVSDAAREHGIAVHAASKAWNLAGLKAAFLVSDGDTMRRTLAERVPGWVPWQAGIFGVIAAEAAYRDGEAWLDDLVAQLADHHQQLRDGLPDGARIAVPAQSTFLAWVDVAGMGLGDDPAARLLAEARLAVGVGGDFGPGWSDHIRINVATGPATIDEGLRRLGSLGR